jgi:hypothetical protein
VSGRLGALSYDVFPLSALASDDNSILRDRVKESLATFECSRSPTLEGLARKDVWRRENHGNSKTYLLVTVRDNTVDVAAFFTLGMGAVDLSDVSPSKKKKLLGNFSAQFVAGFLIAGLARSDRYQSDELPGPVILDEAKRVIAHARKRIGGRYAIVDAQPTVFDKVYAPVGFRQVAVANPPRDQPEQSFNTYMMKITDW